jgi:hypothetical protein
MKGLIGGPSSALVMAGRCRSRLKEYCPLAHSGPTRSLHPHHVFVKASRSQRTFNTFGIEISNARYVEAIEPPNRTGP